jgi:phage terminase small subunit
VQILRKVIVIGAAKDHKLLRGHFTKDQLAKKEKDKASVTPSIKLRVPAIIKNNIEYFKMWKSVIKLYSGTDLLNALDTDLLSRYCIEKCSLETTYRLRDKYYKKLNEDYIDILGIDDLLKLETRIEVKTKMLNQMALALYMTPRARAGSIPNQPDKETVDDYADMFE